LEKRPVESEPIGLPEAPREPASVVSAALSGQLKAILDQAASDHRHFVEAQGTTERLVRAAAGHPAGSEEWTVAQQAVSALETVREPLRRQVAAVEDLRTSPDAAGPAGRALVDQAAGHLAALDGEEARAVASLAAALN
jgi:hypothetical protein